MKNITIRDVAQKAESSIKTVSRVMNNLPYVSDTVRKKVWQAIEELNYTPSPQGKNLANLKNLGIKNRSIGCVLFPNYEKFSEPAFSTLLQELDLSLQKNNIHNFFITTLNELENQSRFINLINPKKIDGCLLVGIGERYKSEIKRISEKINHILIVSDLISDNTISCVLPDNLKGGGMAVEYLIQLGHRKIGCLIGYHDRKGYNEQRFIGYKTALQNNKIPFNPNLVFEGNYDIKKAYSATKDLLKEQNNITAIFATSDMMALGAYKAIQESGLRIPEDISVIGCDNIKMAANIYPSLTTLKTCQKEMADSAVNLLLSEIKENKQTHVKILFPMELVERDSCRKL